MVINRDSKDTEEEIMDFVASNVAHYKKVRKLEFVDAIPKSHSGKIMRRLIKEIMTENAKLNL